MSNSMLWHILKIKYVFVWYIPVTWKKLKHIKLAFYIMLTMSSYKIRSRAATQIKQYGI